MNDITTFEALVEHLSGRQTVKNVAVVWPSDAVTRDAVVAATEAGFIRPIIIGAEEECAEDERVAALSSKMEFRHASNPDEAAAKACRLVNDGEADVIMKGMINTDNLLRAILDKKEGILPQGNVMTHVTVAEIPGYDRLLMFSDAAVIPYPTPEQRRAQIAYIAGIARGLGVESPRIALIHCTEKVDPRHFPFTEDYRNLVNLSAEGKLDGCIVDGPLDVKTSCSAAALKKKGLSSPIEGRADALIFPDILAANTFYKTVTLFSSADMAGLLCGAKVPVVIPSRGDSPRSKYLSLALASL